MDEQYIDFYTKTETDDKFAPGWTGSKDDYDAMTTHDAGTIYTTIDGNGNVVQFLGDVELKSGSGAPIGQLTGLLDGVTNSTIGTATESE